MAIADVQRLLRLPGRLIATPTDKTAAFPYGGTALGYHEGAHFVPRRSYMDVRAQEWGRTLVQAIVGEDFYLGAILRGEDPDAIALFFGSTASDSGEIFSTAPTRLGSYVADVPILHVPLDVTAPCVYFKRGLPQVDAAARVNLQLTEEMGTAVIFKCGATGASDTPCWQIGRLEDFTL